MLCLTCTMISSVDRIGVGRFRIFGGGGGKFQNIGGPRGGGQIPTRHRTS